MTLMQKLFDILTFCFWCSRPVEANIGSEDSSLSDALVLDDGEFLSFALFPVMVVPLLFLIMMHCLTEFNDYFVSDDPQVTGTPTFSPVASPHKGLPPRPPSHSRPPPPQSLDGLRHLHYTRADYDKSPIKPKMWSESSLDEPYEKVKKRSSHSRYECVFRLDSV